MTGMEIRLVTPKPGTPEEVLPDPYNMFGHSIAVKNIGSTALIVRSARDEANTFIAKASSVLIDNQLTHTVAPLECCVYREANGHWWVVARYSHPLGTRLTNSLPQSVTGTETLITFDTTIHDTMGGVVTSPALAIKIQSPGWYVFGGNIEFAKSSSDPGDDAALRIRVANENGVLITVASTSVFVDVSAGAAFSLEVAGAYYLTTGSTISLWAVYSTTKSYNVVPQYSPVLWAVRTL